MPDLQGSKDDWILAIVLSTSHSLQWGFLKQFLANLLKTVWRITTKHHSTPFLIERLVLICNLYDLSQSCTMSYVVKIIPEECIRIRPRNSNSKCTWWQFWIITHLIYTTEISVNISNFNAFFDKNKQIIEKPKHALMLLERQEIIQAVNYEKQQNKRTRQVLWRTAQMLSFKTICHHMLCMPKKKPKWKHKQLFG